MPKVTLIMKKKILLLLTISCISITFAQKNTISANITGFKDNTKVKLFDRDLNELIDSTIVLNNKFVIKTNIKNTIPKNLSLALIKEDGYPISTLLFIANENIKISGDKNDFPFSLNIIGSKNQDLQNSINQQIKDIQTERSEIVNFLRSDVKDTSEDYKTKLKLSKIRLNQIDSLDERICIKAINKNPNSYFALNKLRYYKYIYSKEDLKRLYKKLDAKYKNCENGKSLLNYIEIGDIIKEGDLYSDFEAKDKNENSHNLSDFKGQLILLDFTKEYCAPCEEAIKELKEIEATYGEKIKIISFTAEKSQLYWKKGIIRNNINWLCLWDGNGYSGKTIMKYGVSGFPNFFLINREGKIVKYINGFTKGNLMLETVKLINN